MFNKMKIASGTLMAVLLTSAMGASAALPPEIGVGLTTIEGDALAIVALVWPVVIAVTGAFILFKLFKRGTSKV